MNESGCRKTRVKQVEKQIKAGERSQKEERGRARRGRISPRVNKEGRNKEKMDGEQGRKGARAGGAARWRDLNRD